jgi:hypothetical protein
MTVERAGEVCYDPSDVRDLGVEGGGEDSTGAGCRIV